MGPIEPQQTTFHAKVDIVFCLDVTGSMKPCLEGLKQHMTALVAGLEKRWRRDAQTVAVVSRWRVRTVAFRDLAKDVKVPALVTDLPFVSDLDSFKAQLDDPRLKAAGGGCDGPESALDALLAAATGTPWSAEGSVMRCVILMTDAGTLALRDAGQGRRDRAKGVEHVHDELRRWGCELIVFAPRHPEYEALKSVSPEVEQAWRLFDTTPKAREFFSSEQEYRDVLALVGETVSRTATMMSMKA